MWILKGLWMFLFDLWKWAIPIGALVVAFAASLAMSLPISTPPNAIAFATRAITTRDMIKHGTIVSICGLILVLAVFLTMGDLLEKLADHVPT